MILQLKMFLKNGLTFPVKIYSIYTILKSIIHEIYVIKSYLEI